MAHQIIRPAQRQSAKRMRTEMTEAETRFWVAVRAHRLNGWSFRRQVPMGAFIADFYCAAASLVVEIDGGQHSEDADRARTSALEASGVAVLRFWNNEIIENLEGVREILLLVLEERGR